VCFRGFLARNKAKAEAVRHALPSHVVVVDVWYGVFCVKSSTYYLE
jgi:hypothetical protein